MKILMGRLIRSRLIWISTVFKCVSKFTWCLKFHDFTLMCKGINFASCPSDFKQIIYMVKSTRNTYFWNFLFYSNFCARRHYLEKHTIQWNSCNACVKLKSLIKTSILSKCNAIVDLFPAHLFFIIFYILFLLLYLLECPPLLINLKR